MTLYALVPIVPGPVLSHAEYPQAKEAYPDIASHLYECDETVKDGMWFDGQTFGWYKPPLEEAQSQAWEAIKAERDRRQQDGGVNVGGKWFKSNDQEVGRYVALATLGAKAPATYVLRAAWRTMEDGVVADITPLLVSQILQAGFAQFAAIDDVAQSHKAAMMLAADPLAYDFTGGWPATFT